MKYTTESYIKECLLIHGNKYDYSLTNYLGINKKVSIICKLHGEFKQRAQSHLNGTNCINCYNESRNPINIDYITECTKIHNNKYLYENSIFTGLKKYINIECIKHGQFRQLAYKHLNGQGCKKCHDESSRITQHEFIIRSKIKHNNIYDYSLVKYINSSTKIKILCEKHGIFEQTPNNHLIQGKGCKLCKNRNISKLEISWLDSINIKQELRHKTIKINGNIYHVDALDNENKIIYEFYGDYWHGNPIKFQKNNVNKSNNKKFGDLYNKTILRENILKENGYTIISIWESDFKTKN